MPVKSIVGMREKSKGFRVVPKAPKRIRRDMARIPLLALLQKTKQACSISVVSHNNELLLVLFEVLTHKRGGRWADNLSPIRLKAHEQPLGIRRLYVRSLVFEAAVHSFYDMLVTLIEVELTAIPHK